jgi:hypothetical protein
MLCPDISTAKDLVMTETKADYQTTAPSPYAVEGSTDGMQDVLYLQRPPMNGPVSMGDVNQGSIGDCYLLSSMMEIARQGVTQNNVMGFIPSMIHNNGNGTETVKLYQPTSENAATGGYTFAPVEETVSNASLPSFGATGATYDGMQEIWPAVIEEAYAQMMGGYSVLNQGGWPSDALMALTGQDAWTLAPAGLSYQDLIGMTNNHDLITFDTAQGTGAANPYNLVDTHAYAFGGYAKLAGAASTIQLVNPWGYDNPAPIPISAIANGTANINAIDVGHFGAGYGTPMTSLSQVPLPEVWWR